MVFFFLPQGKRKKRKREKLQDSGAGKPPPPPPSSDVNSCPGVAAEVSAAAAGCGVSVKPPTSFSTTRIHR